MDIKEQIAELRRMSQDYVDCGAHCDLEIEAADTMEKLLAVYEAAIRVKRCAVADNDCWCVTINAGRQLEQALDAVNE